jgi:hypothetical protein
MFLPIGSSAGFPIAIGSRPVKGTQPKDSKKTKM